MNYKYFPLQQVMPPADCPDMISVVTFDGLQREVRVIKTDSVFGVVIDNIYLSLASGEATFRRGNYALIKDTENKIWLGINEDLY